MCGWEEAREERAHVGSGLAKMRMCLRFSEFLHAHLLDVDIRAVGRCEKPGLYLPTGQSLSENDEHSKRQKRAHDEAGGEEAPS